MPDVVVRPGGVERGSRVTRESGRVERPDAQGGVITGELAVDDGPGTDDPVGQRRRRSEEDAVVPAVRAAKAAVGVETDHRGGIRPGEGSDRQLRGVDAGAGSAGAALRRKERVITSRQGHRANGLRGVHLGPSGMEDDTAGQADRNGVAESVRQILEIGVRQRELAEPHGHGSRIEDRAVVSEGHRSSGDQRASGVSLRIKQVESVGAHLGEVDVGGDDTAEAAVGVGDEGRLGAGLIGQRASLLVLTGAGSDAVEGSDELGASVEVDGAAEVDGEGVVGQQRVHRACLKPQRAAVDERGAADELPSVQVQHAPEALDHAAGAAEAAGDIEGLAGSDMDDAFGRAGGAESDDRYAERGRRASAASVHQQGAGRKRERGRGQTRQAADGRGVADQRPRRDRQRVERLVAGERVGRGRSRTEGLRGGRAEDVGDRRVAVERSDAGGGRVGGELVAEDGDLGKQSARGRRQGRGGREEEPVGRRAEGPDDVQAAAGVDGQRGEGQRGGPRPGQADGVAADVGRENAGRLGGRIRDELEGAALQGDASAVDAVIPVGARVIETQHGAAGDGGERVGAPEGDRAVGGGQDDGSAVDLETAAVVDRAGDGRIDGQGTGTVLIQAPQRAGLRTGRAGEHDVAFGVELETVGARRGDQAGEGERAARPGTDGRVPRMGDGAGVGVGTRDALQLAAEIDAALQDVVHPLEVQRITDGHVARQT